MALTYDSEGRLREDEQEIARIEPAERPAFARVSTEAGVHEIVRRRRRGWRFLLVDASSGRVTYDFRPALVRRGGTITGEGHALVLHTHHRHGYAWLVSSPDAGSIDVAAGAHAAGRPGEEEGTPRELQGIVTPALRLDGDAAGPLCAQAPALVAFVCWLVAEWEEVAAMAGRTSGARW